MELIRKIPILAGGRIIVPGTEPSTNITNVSLEAIRAGGGLPMVRMITANEALRLIPGSSIESMMNSGGYPQKSLVLPAGDINMTGPDWYKILFDASRPATEEDIEDITSDQYAVFDTYSDMYGS